MTLSPRTVLAAVALVATAACLDITPPQHPIVTHTLMATTDIIAGDSIQCVVFAQLPLPDSIRAPWTGATQVQVRRYRNTPTGPVQLDTIPMNATISISRGTGDSLYVAIQGAFSLVLSGRLTASPYEASGPWQCDDRIPLSRGAPGQATGKWYLTTDRVID